MLGYCLELLIYLSGLSLLCAVVCVVIILKSDADLFLMLKTKFGKQPSSLRRKVVWITGASSGIGEHIALELARAGCRLVLSARREEELQRVKDSCLKCGTLAEEDIFVLPVDVLAFDSHKDAAKSVIDKFGQIDILMNNAGRSQRAEWINVDLTVDREMFEVNVLGQVSLTQAVLPYMMERKEGMISVLSSLAGVMGVPMSRSYTGSKHAIHGYFDCLRAEMGQYNIDVCLVCPGPVFSNLFVYAFTGKTGENLNRPMQPTDNRMTTARCAYLTAVALANRMYQVWLAQNPVLIMTYLAHYFPSTSNWYFQKYGVSAIMKMREGKL